MPRRDAPAFFDKCNCLRLSPFPSPALANAGRGERRLHTVAVIILNQAAKVKTCHTFFAIPARKTFRADAVTGIRARADATFLRSVALRAPSRSKSYLPVAYPQTGKYPARNGHPRKPLIRSSRSGQADGQITFFEVKCPQGTSRKKLHLPTPPSSRSQAADHLPTPPSSALKPPHSSSITSLFILRSTALLTCLRTISVISPSIFSDGR